MKILDRGYWISKLFFYQSLIYYFVYAIRFRSLVWFSACNPKIDLGGMLDDKKSDVYNLLPSDFLPKTFLCSSPGALVDIIAQEKLVYPLIVKPDVGFKGYLVIKVSNQKELLSAAEKINEIPFLVQEFVALKKEFSLLFFKKQNGDFGITSLVEKSYPFVLGDGTNSIEYLIEKLENPFVNAELLIKNAEKTFLHYIPKMNEKVIIEEIGNYSRGAKFHSLMECISKKLIIRTNNYFSSEEGLNFFRLDFKSDSLESYMDGDFKILELNGAKSEPLHIYDNKHSIYDSIHAIHRHWMILVSIVKEQQSNRYVFPSTKQGWRSLVTARKIGK